MKKTTIPATDFGKKTYAQPRMRVVEIVEESLLCQSVGGNSTKGSSTQQLDEDEFKWGS